VFLCYYIGKLRI